MLRGLLKKILFRAIGALALLKPLLKNKSRHVYVIGDLYSESGLGNVTRALVKTLDGVVEYSVINLPMSVASKQGDYEFGSHLKQRLGPGVNIFVGNPSILLLAFCKLNPLRLLSNQTIGVWFWELEHIPSDWRVASRLVDEVWAQSDFVARAFKGASGRVAVMPFVVDPAPTCMFDRRHFGIGEDRYVFLMTFDYLSHVARKNPEAVVRAFKAEFGDDPSVLLVIKSVNKSKGASVNSEVESIIEGSRNILSIDSYLDKAELLSLISVADCYVSLHRSEGLGLGMAEAMNLGTLVIATGYSGNMDFMSTDSALLVDYTLKPVDAAEYPYAADNRWANPDEVTARAQMRRVKDTAQDMRSLIDEARRRLSGYNTANQRAWVAEQLGQLR